MIEKLKPHKEQKNGAFSTYEVEVIPDREEIMNKINEIVDVLNQYEQNKVLTEKDIINLKYKMFPESIIMR